MGRLYIKTELKNEKTVIADSFFSAPFKIMGTFDNNGICEIMIMQASAGILCGDKLEIELDIKSGSRVMITGQSYTKIFRCDGMGSKQNVKINVENGAELLYLPPPVIPFEKSYFVNMNDINIESGTKLIIWDIFAAGRIGMGEQFLFTKYHTRTEVRENGQLIFGDSTRLVPDEVKLEGTGFFENCTHFGTAYFFGFGDIKTNKNIAITKAYKGNLIRTLSHSSDEIVKNFEKIIKKTIEEEC